MDEKQVLFYFNEILKIPRPSYHEGAIADYLCQFGQKKGLTVCRDAYNNVMIKKPGSTPSAPAVVLQAHTDMVWVSELEQEQSPQIPHEVHIKDGTMKTHGTTLGADDGIGVAMILAILDEENPSLPPMEAVFTANEEETMEGAMMLKPTDLQGSYLINLDSEQEGVVTIGAAGGISSVCTLPAVKKASALQHGVRIQVTGGKGGHSGLEIHKKRENAILLLARILRSLETMDWELAKIEGGSRSNAIPGHATAELNTDHPQELRQAVEAFVSQCQGEWQDEEIDLQIEAADTAPAATAYEGADRHRILLLLENLPHGVKSQTEEFVCSSVNLAILQETPQGVCVELSLRSSFSSWYRDEVKRIARLVQLLGGTAEEKDAYAAWQYQKDSRLLQVAQEVYQTLFEKEILCENVHAGVECGIIMEQCPSIREAISMGPTIRHAHTTKEELEVDSVFKVYRLMRGILCRINATSEGNFNE